MPGMRMMQTSRDARSSYTVGLVVLTALFLPAGCQQAQRVINPLPAPAVARQYIPPPVTPQPRPTPIPAPPRNLSGTRVVIDPGHGGKDPGAWKGTSSRLPEKTIVLDIANQVAATLRSEGINTISTRTSDVFIELDDRAGTAERHKADLFVSIHADSAPRKSAAGAEVHIYTKASSDSQQAAIKMLAALKRSGIHCRTIHRNNFHVLREHSRPAILVECGFLTNRGDAQKLNIASYRQEIASAIAQGVIDYLSR